MSSQRHVGAAFLVSVVSGAIMLAAACTDPPGAGQLVLDIDRLAVAAGISQVNFTADKLLLFYGQAPARPLHKDVDCTSGQTITFTPEVVTLDLTRTGRTPIAAVNAPPGTLLEVWLLLSGATVTENGLSRPLHPDLNCATGDDGVVRLTSIDPNGVVIKTNEATEIAAQFNPNTDLIHKDPDNAGGNGGNGKGKKQGTNPDANGDLHGGLWSLAQSLPFLLVNPSGIVDGEIIVRFKDGTSAADMQNAITAQSMTVLRGWPPYYHVLKVPNGADERSILQYYAAQGIVQYVTPNTYVGTAHTFDGHFLEQTQWPQVGLNEICQGGTGTAPACDGIADPASGWANGHTGSFDPVVAIIDENFDLGNPDLLPNWFINPDEVPRQVLEKVGDLNKDNVVDWHDLDTFMPDSVGVLTFADLQATDDYCFEAVSPQPFHSRCAVGTPLLHVVCPDGCTPTGLVSGAGRADPDHNTCGTKPHPITYGWEDGVDGNGGQSGCNGFTDDIVGWNFGCNAVGGGNPPVAGCNKVDVSGKEQVATNYAYSVHGTSVATIVGARGANGIDTAGIAWKVRLLPVQLGPSKQSIPASTGELLATRDTIFPGVRYVNTLGSHVDVVNMSLQSYALMESELPAGALACPNAPTVPFKKDKVDTFNSFVNGFLRDELVELQKDLLAAGSLVVVAAGNCTINHDDTIGFSGAPAVFNFPGSMSGTNVLTVAAVGAQSHANADKLSDFSDFGPKGVDLAAPGEFFVVATVDRNLDYAGGTSTDVDICGQPGPAAQGCRGTSFSAPMVAGTAALILSADKSLANKPCQLADRILRNATSVTLLNRVAGNRRLNVADALANTNSVLGAPRGRRPPARPALTLAALRALRDARAHD